MRHDVTTPSYLFRKTVDNILEALTSSSPSSLSSNTGNGSTDPGKLSYTMPLAEDGTGNAFAPEPFGWLPLYSMVTFQPHLSYSAARRRAQYQTRVLRTVEQAILFGATLAVGWTAWTMRAHWR